MRSRRANLVGLAVLVLVLAMFLAACGDDETTTTTTGVPATEPTTVSSVPATDETTTSSSEATSTTAASTEPIKVGVLWPITGTFSTGTESGLSTFKLDVDNLNAHGGVNGRQIELVIQDDQGDSAPGAAAYAKLVDEDVSMIVGAPVNVVFNGALDLAEKSNIPFLSTTVPPLGQPDNWTWSFVTSKGPELQGPLFVEFAQSKGWKSILICPDFVPVDGDTAKVTKDVGEAAGLTVTILPDTYSVVETNVGPICNKIEAAYKETKPDVIFLYTGMIAFTYIVKELKARGIEGPFMASATCAHPFIFSLGPEIMNGVYIQTQGYASPATLPDSWAGKEYLVGFEQMWLSEYPDVPVDFFCAVADQNVVLMVEALKQGGSDPVAIREALENMKDFPTPGWGSTSYSAEHHTPSGQSVFNYVCQDGTFVFESIQP